MDSHGTHTLDRPLHDRVHTALAASPHVPHGSLCFETRQGHVTLRGVVRSYYQKQMAQETLRHLDGVQGIDNQLEVCWM